MTFDPDIHHRRSIRLRNFNYAADGAYFVTICVHEREQLFGRVVDGEMMMNDAGRMVESWWRKIPEKFGNARLDEYVIMPDHFHGIVHLVGADPGVRPEFDFGVDKQGAHTGAPLPAIVQWFKTMTTNVYIRGVDTDRWISFPGRLWQRNYFERIIRDDAELQRLRDDMVGNPVRWKDDE